ncbi:hypothetical protein FACS1894111_07870 [Clostridia bacterium]|nr:hypothetical protein FACS1894111_07870 [Clostridia bacterium]
MDTNVFDLIQRQKAEEECRSLMLYNEKTASFGLSLTAEEAHELVAYRDDSLKEHRRVEFGKGILDALVFAFCDSPYIGQADYLETLKGLTDLFYLFKNESEDKLTDDELMTFMREQFDEVCCGDLDYLGGTCLTRFVTAIRGGYRKYQASGGKNEYEALSEEMRWDPELYRQILTELAWR